jgi:hypothetical protein
MKFNSKSLDENSFKADRFNNSPEEFYSDHSSFNSRKSPGSIKQYIVSEVIRQNQLAQHSVSAFHSIHQLGDYGQYLRSNSPGMPVIGKLSKRLLYPCPSL